MVKGGVVVFGLDCGRFSLLTTHITEVDFKAMQLVCKYILCKYIQVLRRNCYNSIFNPTPPVNLDQQTTNFGDVLPIVRIATRSIF